MTLYEEFLAAKRRHDPATGLTDLPALPDRLFPFQHDIVSWALRRGRAAIFANTGTGKSFMELAWGRAVHHATGGNVLLLAPLAVAGQMVREAHKFGLPAKQCATQADVEPGITVTNYAKLHHFDLTQFVGVILDESSILKAFDGKTRSMLIERCKDIPYRLCATATPAPNDFMELGNHAEFLGVMSLTGMQATFFTHDGGDTSKWRLKGYAENDFWQWMCSWSVLLRRPSDLGYDDGAYDLPELIQIEHLVQVDGPAASTMSERIVARRESIAERVAKAVEILTRSYSEWEKQQRNGASITPQIANSGEQTSEPRTADTLMKDWPQTSAGKNPCPPRQCESITEGTTPRTSIVTRRDPLPLSSGCTVSTRILSPDCSSLRGASVPSAENPRLEKDDSTSTIATQPDKSGESYATPAIHASGDSTTTSICSLPRASLPKLSTYGEPNRPWLIWCNLNSEQDALAAALGDLAFSISGSDSESAKEIVLARWLAGERPFMLSKAKILGFGLNFQFCADTIFVGLNDSFEQVYQATRRFWRFGQTKPVTVHFVAASTEGAVLDNLRRKEADAERMGSAMVANMADLSSEIIHGATRATDAYAPTLPVCIPNWLFEDDAA